MRNIRKCRRMLQKETRGSYEKYKKLQKDAKKLCKRKRKNIYRSNLRKLNSRTDRTKERNFTKQWIISGKATSKTRSMQR
jgi:hypothetical protein